MIFPIASMIVSMFQCHYGGMETASVWNARSITKKVSMPLRGDGDRMQFVQRQTEFFVSMPLRGDGDYYAIDFLLEYSSSFNATTGGWRLMSSSRC